MRLMPIISKLQRSLLQKGRMIKVNQTQMYSERRNAMLTRYTVIEKQTIDDVKKNVTLLETFKALDVVNLLKEINGGG